MKIEYRIICVSFFISLLYLPHSSICLTQGELLGGWAEALGKQLWSLGTIVTKRNDIENSYALVKLETKDPQQIISEIVRNVSYMMQKKMEAVKCIIDAAEHAAEKFVLNDTKHDYYYHRSNPPIQDESIEVIDFDHHMFLSMDLDSDTHFFNLSVNTTYSSVHLPTNVYHKHVEAETAIRWSEVLDNTFYQNYRADPALYWQYFGSSSGILRHYPAMNWTIDDQGLFDCRIRTWFIEAATCTKDVVILVDNSGSMSGWSKHIAFMIVKTIMQTLSNNDYVNVLNFSDGVNYTIPCFTNMLVQATEENIAVFEDAITQMEPLEKSYVDKALIKGFELLYKYRDIRNCVENSRMCNQAIMLITDGVPDNLTDIISVYNRLDNDTIPIRIFTYLVGKEPVHLTNSMWIACTNRGYHSHVDSLEQVTSSVYKYVLVLARPLVLQAKSHPLSWTHAYFDETFYSENKSSSRFEDYRLLTSVAGPAFNLKAQKDNETKTAELLGVAGTDVPIGDIAKLMYSYKTGVNSHSFIVSNNGYVLKHPGLRPMVKGILTENYHSIDLTEVEQLDDDSGPREIGLDLEELRTAMVEGRSGVKHDLKIKYHYDDQRRVSREINDYYFAPINGTPFTLGFAIPDLYGNYSIQVGDEIEMHRFSQINISTYFDGNNWKIHPKWVYCKFHYLEGHEFVTPEKEVMEFINRLNTPDFKWSMQYEADDVEYHNKHKVECGAKTLGDHDYYCDRNLMQRLVFDAKTTKPAFDEPWTYRNSEENNLRILYNATLRFIATLSGLTRWEYIGDTQQSSTLFGDMNPRAIDETWYKGAVIQHRFNNFSFVYAVPFDSTDDKDLLVTASYAIFPRKDDIETPAAVLGFQFSHSHLYDQFFELAIPSPMCPDCFLCGNELACYIIDSSGYIIISQDKANTGKFFGDIEGVAMETMLQIGVFEKVTIRDYQALCMYYKWVKGNSNILMTTFSYVKLILNWILSKIIWLTIKINVSHLWGNLNWILINAEEITTTTTPKPVVKKCHKSCNEREEEWHVNNSIPVYEERNGACEMERDLYILQQELFTDKDFYPEEVILDGCTRPFYMKMVPYSNLLLVAIKTIEEETCYFVHSAEYRDIVYENETTYPCQKLYLNNLTRSPLQGCFNQHPLEHKIEGCGRSGRMYVCLNLLIISIIIFIVQP